ncbi:LCP family protein required for cell wall assembly [Pullulanibacillus pueri]|uniref:Transcriptional regulator LytR n=1 Tax=Pullulanibacillus pueri TaxID=1437324 RepID=A0A8J2ZVH7_9BACL|nr:LCP family protein [Pullulanibacillus pueri]MBM7682444.1 LCP family protein required for cell wall assembly [Pullulanibacillus pueri]GGH81615.1 transcriptional regulator LytR [Pullulanibacillus pueri]
MKRRKLKLTFIIIGTLLGLFFVSVGGYAYYLYHSVKQTAQEVYKPLSKDEDDVLPLDKSRSKDAKKTAEEESPPAINILLLGVDERKGDKGRSDTMIVATLNPRKKALTMTSIPRDTRVHIEGRSGFSKINAAYAYGDEALAVQTVEDYLNIDIAYYVKINMEGLDNLVDAVGGVTVNNTLDWKDSDFHFTTGTLHLNGKEALAYSRMRHDDPQGDFGRNERQRQVIQAIINQGKSLIAVKNINTILSALGDNVQTNLSFSDMKLLATDYRDCRQKISNYEVQGTPKYLDGVSWVLVSDEERQHVHDLIETAFKG